MFKQLRKLFTGHASSPPGMPMPSTPQLSLISAEAFENDLLNWLKADMGLKPVSCSGTNARYWSFVYSGHEVHLAVIGPQHNTSTPPAPGIDWILRIEEPKPLAFVAVMAQHFVASHRIQRKMPGSGKTRVQFKSSEWLSQRIEHRA